VSNDLTVTGSVRVSRHSVLEITRHAFSHKFTLLLANAVRQNVLNSSVTLLEQVSVILSRLRC